MSRAAGTRNPDYARKRAALLDAVIDRLLGHGPLPSFRELAAEASVSVPTLRHYFRNREGVIIAALERFRERGAPHIAIAAQATQNDVYASLRGFLDHVLNGWRNFGVGKFYAGGLTIGMYDAQVGPAFVRTMLEPLLQSAEQRLAQHHAWGELHVPEPRLAALQLISPVYLAMLHQDALGGDEVRKLDVDAQLRPHVESFIRAYAPR